MAKGALPVEDAAVHLSLSTLLARSLVFQALRLRATLERNAAINRGLRESTTDGG